MELFYSFSYFLLRSLLLSFAIYISFRHVLQTIVVYSLSRSQAAAIASAVVCLYDTVLWPHLLSPLKKFPIVRVSSLGPLHSLLSLTCFQLNDMRYLIPVTDVPRGDVALQWAKAHPTSDIVRVSVWPQIVLTAFSPRALRDIVGTQQADFIKPLSGSNYLSRLLGYGLILSEGPTHSRQRKSLTSSFRIQNIRALHELMLAKTKIMMMRMEEQAIREGRCEVSSWASKATLDIIGPSLMSQDFDALRSDRQPVNESFTELTAVDSGQTIHFIASMFLPKAVVAMLPTKTNRMIERNVKVIRNACSDSLDARGSVTEKATVGSEILTSVLQDPQADRREVIDQMITFLGAGHETTATSVAWAVHLLTLPQNLHYQEALHKELSEHPGCTSSAIALEALPLLNAICEETLRLYPPVTTTARKAIRDTTVAGVAVPKGTIIILFPWVVNRNPQYWGGVAADQFIPERWIERDQNGQARLNKHGGAESNYCELTFLHGNRACIGMNFAKAELRCILANMFMSFKLSRLPGDDLIAEPAGSLTIKPKGGLYVGLQRVDVK